MKILVIEDLDGKADQVNDVLAQTVAANHLTCERAKSFRGGIKMLEANIYDVLVLDLVLPVRDGEIPTEQGGKQLLAEIVNGSECKRPSHIICLTAFEESIDILKDEVERNLVHVVIYREGDSKWRKSLEAKVSYVQRRLIEAEVSPKEYLVDVAIVTSSPNMELKEVTKLPGSFVAEYNQTDALYYYSANWTNKMDRKVTVVACSAPSMGMTAACVTACKVIERWRPRFLVMTGIAAGTAKEQRAGDVLVAEAAYDYGSGKIAETEDGGRLFIPSPSQLRIDAELQAILQRWERDQTQMDAVRHAWYRDEGSIPRLILGLIASGSAVVQNVELVKEILSKSRKVIGLEMEAYAIFQAAHLASGPRPRVLVAKSICDFADKNKKDDWQQYAAFTSARFVYEFFTTATELRIGA